MVKIKSEFPLSYASRRLPHSYATVRENGDNALDERFPTAVLNGYNRIFTIAIGAGYIFIGVPVVFPFGFIDEIPKLIVSARL